MPKTEETITQLGEVNKSSFTLDQNSGLIVPRAHNNLAKIQTHTNPITGTKFQDNGKGLLVAAEQAMVATTEPPKILVSHGSADETGSVRTLIKSADVDIQIRLRDAKNAEEDEDAKPKFSTAEVALAQADIRHFVRNYLETQLDTSDENVRWVIEAFTDPKFTKPQTGAFAEPDPDIPTKAFQRKTRTIMRFDKETMEKVKMTSSTSGPFERAACLVLEAISQKEMDFIAGSPNDVQKNALTIMSEVIRSYRLKSGLDSAPEMPNLAHQLRETADRFNTRRELRDAVYDIARQVEIPTSEKEAFLFQMQRDRDLKHPLAFEMHIDLAISHPESPWITKHEARRQKLLLELEAPAQELIDRYQDLKRESDALVVAFDVTHPPLAKIGLEIECATGALATPLTHGYTLGRDGNGMEEIKSARTNLDFGTTSIQELAALGRFARDNLANIGSMHIHFDLSTHPQKIDIYGWVPDISHIRRLHTQEVRGAYVPLTDRRQLDTKNIAHLQIMLGLIGREEEPGRNYPLELPREASLNYAILGHVSTRTRNPEARLCALKLLETSNTFASMNPAALVQTYDKEAVAVLIKLVEESKFMSERVKNSFWLETRTESRLQYTPDEAILRLDHTPKNEEYHRNYIRNHIKTFTDNPDNASILGEFQHQVEYFGTAFLEFPEITALIDLLNSANHGYTTENFYYKIVESFSTKEPKSLDEFIQIQRALSAFRSRFKMRLYDRSPDQPEYEFKVLTELKTPEELELIIDTFDECRSPISRNVTQTGIWLRKLYRQKPELFEHYKSGDKVSKSLQARLQLATTDIPTIPTDPQNQYRILEQCKTESYMLREITEDGSALIYSKSARKFIMDSIATEAAIIGDTQTLLEIALSSKDEEALAFARQILDVFKTDTYTKFSRISYLLPFMEAFPEELESTVWEIYTSRTSDNRVDRNKRMAALLALSTHKESALTPTIKETFEQNVTNAIDTPIEFGADWEKKYWDQLTANTLLLLILKEQGIYSTKDVNIWAKLLDTMWEGTSDFYRSPKPKPRKPSVYLKRMSTTLQNIEANAHTESREILLDDATNLINAYSY